MNLIPNISPKTFSASAIIVGYLLIDNLTANEQNALGNWLMLTAQVLCTNAYYKQVQQERNIAPEKSKEKQEIDMLPQLLNALEKEVNKLKSNIGQRVIFCTNRTLKIEKTQSSNKYQETANESNKMFFIIIILLPFTIIST